MTGSQSLTDPSRALREAGLRPTRQRLSVIDCLRERPDAVTAQELHRLLREAGQPIGLTTVYRTLTALADVGLLDRLDREGEQGFRLCGAMHHHHLVCERCGAVEELEAEEVERWVSQVAERHGFAVTAHRADIVGICALCR